MVTHMVFWNLKETANGKTAEENALELKKQLLALKAVIPQIKSISCGEDFNASDAAYDFGLYTLFDSKEDLNAYQVHPEHVKVGAFVKSIVSARAVVDFED